MSRSLLFSYFNLTIGCRCLSVSFRVHFRDDAIIQRAVMEFVDVPQIVAHIHSDFLPREIAEIPFFQKRLMLRVGYCLDYAGDLRFQIDEFVHVAAYLIFEIYDFGDGICHP